MRDLFRPRLPAVDLDEGFITDHKEIISELVKSKLNGNSIALSAPLLGSGAFITGIADILLAGEDSIVILKHYDTNGYFLPINAISLKHIKAVSPFISKFENPFVQKSAELK